MPLSIQSSELSSGNGGACSRSSVQILEVGSTKSLSALMAVYMKCPSLSYLHVQASASLLDIISREQERLTDKLHVLLYSLFGSWVSRAHEKLMRKRFHSLVQGCLRGFVEGMKSSTPPT